MTGSNPRKKPILILLFLSILFLGDIIDVDSKNLKGMAPVEIKIKAVVGRKICQKNPRWEQDIRTAVEIASEYYRGYRVKFSVEKFITMAESQFQICPLKDEVVFLKHNVAPGSCDVVLIITAYSPRQTDPVLDLFFSLFVRNYVGMVNKIGGDKILVVSEPSKENTTKLVWIIAHEMGHILGGQHSEDKSSLMHQYFTPAAICLDAVNAGIILKNKFRFNKK